MILQRYYFPFVKKYLLRFQIIGKIEDRCDEDDNLITFRLVSVGEERPQGRFRFITNDDVNWHFSMAGRITEAEKWHSLKDLD